MRVPSRFHLHRSLKTAIQRSPLSLTALGFPVGIGQSCISRYLHGKTFGPVVRDRFIRLGASLGVPMSACTVKVSR